MIRFIAEHKDQQVDGPGGAGLRWGVEPMCAVLSEHGVPISPSTHYQWIAKTPTCRQVRDAELVEIITAACEDKKPTQGRGYVLTRSVRPRRLGPGGGRVGVSNVDLPVALSVSCANVDGSSQINLKGEWT